MNRIGRVVSCDGEIESLQNVQHLNDVNTAGTGRRHGIHIVTAVRAVHGFPDDGLVSRQIFLSDPTPVMLHLGGDEIGDLSTIEGFRPFFGDKYQRTCQIFLNESIPRLVKTSVGFEEYFPRRLPLPEPFGPSLDALAHVGSHHIPPFGQLDGGFDEFF